MQGHALDILGENGRSGLAHDAGHKGGLVQLLLLDQQFKSTKTSLASRDFVSAGLGPGVVENRADIQALQQPATFDVSSQFVNRKTGLHTSDIGLGQDQFVERNVTRGTERDFGNSGRHGEKLHDGLTGDSPLPSQPVTEIPTALFLSTFMNSAQ